MNGIIGVSFQEIPGGLRVNIKKAKNKSSPGKLKKRLPYNFKQMSRQIMTAKTSDAARPLVTRIQAKLSWLYKKLKSDEYGDSEIAAAIIHAARMEKIAKRKVRHLEEEEAAENGNGIANAPGEDEEIYDKDELQKSMEESEDFSEEVMKKMMEEIEQLEKELVEDSMSEIQDMISCAGGNLSEEEIDELKRKHRSEEERQLTRADLEYLKALFDRLEQEKKQASSGLASVHNPDSSTVSYVIDSMPESELADIEIGENIDLSI